jgi:hypothetical protein
MSVRTNGEVTIHETTRGDFAIVINDVDVAFADTQLEAESFRTFISAFAVSYTFASSALAYIREFQNARKARELARPIDAHSELLETRSTPADPET